MSNVTETVHCMSRGFQWVTAGHITSVKVLTSQTPNTHVQMVFVIYGGLLQVCRVVRQAVQPDGRPAPQQPSHTQLLGAVQALRQPTTRWNLFAPALRTRPMTHQKLWLRWRIYYAVVAQFAVNHMHIAS